MVGMHPFPNHTPSPPPPPPPPLSAAAMNIDMHHFVCKCRTDTVVVCGVHFFHLFRFMIDDLFDSSSWNMLNTLMLNKSTIIVIINLVVVNP